MPTSKKPHNPNTITVLFDLDGTLLDTANDLTSAFNHVMGEYSDRKYTLAETRKLVGYGSKQLFELALADNMPASSYEQFVQKFRAAYLALAHQKTALFDGVTELINQLNQEAITWGIVTNKPYQGAVHALESFPLLQSNHCLVGGDTAEYPKPAPEPLYYACSLLNIQPQEAIFIGDTPVDMEAGYLAKMDTVAVAYGYGVDDIKTSKYTPKFWVEHPSEILSIVKNYAR